MNRSHMVLVTAVVLLSGVLGATHQTIRPDAVLVRDSNNQLFVSTVLGRPGDTVGIVGGQVVVNGLATALRVRPTGDWGPRQLERGTYFVGGDPPAWVSTSVRGA